MTDASGSTFEEDPVDEIVDDIVSRLGLHDAVETEASSDDHAAEVAEVIADASAAMARFEDTRDAT